MSEATAGGPGKVTTREPYGWRALMARGRFGGAVRNGKRAGISHFDLAGTVVVSRNYGSSTSQQERPGPYGGRPGPGQ